MTDGSEVLGLHTSAEIVREERTCFKCHTTTTVDVVRTERATDYEDQWDCPICQHSNIDHTDDTGVDEPDPDSWHDAMREED